MLRTLYSFQEILNLYSAHAPVFPHDKNTDANWFTKMIAEADMKINFRNSIVTTITDNDIKDIIDAVINNVYDRHDEDIIYMIDACEEHTLSVSDFPKAIKKLVNVLEMTIPKYIPLFIENKKATGDPIGKISSSTTGTTRFNDTPQNDGNFNDDSHATNVSESSSESLVDTGSLVSRLDEMFKNFRSILLEWSNEFNRIFIKEAQLYE